MFLIYKKKTNGNIGAKCYMNMLADDANTLTTIQHENSCKELQIYMK